MATEMGPFLRAEEAASELLNSLGRLKDEIEGYSRAKGTLEEVRGQLVSLVQSLGRTVEQSTSVMAALERIGTPEILKEIENVVALNDNTVAAFEGLRKDVSEAIPNMGSRIEKAIADNSESIKSANSATNNQMSEHVGVVKKQIESLSETLTNDISKLGKQIEQQCKAIKLMISIGLPLIAIIMSVVVFFVKGS